MTIEITGNKRILFVEDSKILMETFVEEIHYAIENVTIDQVSSLEGALTAIHNKTYHVAILDIMLGDDVNRRGGLDVLDAILNQKVGTLAVMLSGTLDISCAIHAIRSRFVVDYIHKNELTAGSDKLLEPLKRALDEAHIPIYGKYGRLTSFLAAPEEPSKWEFEAVHAMDGVGFEQLNRALAATFKDVTPVLPAKEINLNIQIDGDRKAVYGAFWSKAIGEAIWVCIWNRVTAPFIHERCQEKHYQVKLSGKIDAAIWQLNISRDEFHNSLWEI